MITNQLDQLYRQQAGQLIAACTAYFGMINLETAEDIVHETFEAAYTDWQIKGLPDDPVAWLFKVCKNKTLNLLKKGNRSYATIDLHQKDRSVDAFDQVEINEQQVRWLYAAAVPSFSPRMRMIFMLKIVHGIKVKDISALLIMKESAVQKMYERALKKVKEQPHIGILENTVIDHSRLPSIINALYLIFTLGYDRPWQVDSGGDLCYDALRLTKCLVDSPGHQQSMLLAFYSLLLFHSARLPSRWSAEGRLCDLENQDRTQWNREMIQLGVQFLNKSTDNQNITKYHIEATIASLHCLATTWNDTPWQKITRLYERMAEQHPSPYVNLNLSIALLQSEGPNVALSFLHKQSFSSFVKNHQYHSTLSRIYESAEDIPKAIHHLKLAINFAKQKAVIDYLNERLASLS